MSTLISWFLLFYCGYVKDCSYLQDSHTGVFRGNMAIYFLISIDMEKRKKRDEEKERTQMCKTVCIIWVKNI